MYKAIIISYVALCLVAASSYAWGQSCLTTYVGGSAITTCR